MSDEVLGDDDEDGARQHERTSLAWVRTALAAVGVGLFTVRVTQPGHERWLVAAGTVLGVVGIVAAAWQRSRRLQHEQVAAPLPEGDTVVLLASLLLLNVVGLLVVL
jgi:uncharacterized membrane protein YidH (DUF202 family)